ncbi:unnamed protein product [Nippostrongylus brasiliensis]|uniref:Uncharacterized protein n=1 Tax=Nippostrongylus brasiliensis TaxID=27835 RepID=A0A0N4YG13_NIPBR|nr:unnamed protein product [Nippostrongylus brasiliensis]
MKNNRRVFLPLLLTPATTLEMQLSLMKRAGDEMRQPMKWKDIVDFSPVEKILEKADHRIFNSSEKPAADRASGCFEANDGAAASTAKETNSLGAI